MKTKIKILAVFIIAMVFFLLTIVAARADDCHLYSCQQDSTSEHSASTVSVNYGYENVGLITSKKSNTYKFSSRIRTTRAPTKTYTRVWTGGTYYKKDGVTYSFSQRNDPYTNSYSGSSYRYGSSYGSSNNYNWNYNPVGYSHNNHRSNLNSKYSYNYRNTPLQTQYNRGSMPNNHGLI